VGVLLGVIFVLISLFRLREYIINSIPKNLKLALCRRRIVPRHHRARRGQDRGGESRHAGDAVISGEGPVVLCPWAFILIAALNARRIGAATLLGVLAVTLIGLPFGLASHGGIVSTPPSRAPTLPQLDFSRALAPAFAIVVLSFLFVDLFDNAGTLVGVAHRPGLLDQDGKPPSIDKRVCAGRRRGRDHAAHLFDRRRHRARLALAKLIAGEFADLKPAVLVLAVLFAAKFALPRSSPTRPRPS
jgi:adenine/guanine/hypoxanthine permease